MTQGVDIELPKAASEPVDTQDNEPLIISVDAEGNYYINLGQDETQPKSAEQIAAQIKQILSVNPAKLMLVRGDKSASYDQVVQLMVLMQGAGAERVGLVTE